MVGEPKIWVDDDAEVGRMNRFINWNILKVVPTGTDFCFCQGEVWCILRMIWEAAMRLTRGKCRLVGVEDCVWMMLLCWCKVSDRRRIIWRHCQVCR